MLYNKIPIQILGATGVVGRKLISLLMDHPFFYIHTLSASKQSVNKKLKEVDPAFSHHEIGEKVITDCSVTDCNIVLSALDASVAHEIEGEFAHRQKMVFSNTRCYRLKEGHLLSMPEISHYKIRDLGNACVITNPNCCVAGLSLALFPILQKVKASHMEVVTQQSVSGAGYPGVPSLDILNNVIPYIPGEEEKIVNEMKYLCNDVQPKESWDIYPTCTRVPVLEGHLMSVSLQLTQDMEEQDIIDSWNNFSFDLPIPSATKHPLVYLKEENMPQPKWMNEGMKVLIGRLRKDKNHLRFMVLVHNLIRGAAGATLLNAETWYYYHIMQNLKESHDEKMAYC